MSYSRTALISRFFDIARVRPRLTLELSCPTPHETSVFVEVDSEDEGLSIEFRFFKEGTGKPSIMRGLRYLEKDITRPTNLEVQTAILWILAAVDQADPPVFRQQRLSDAELLRYEALASAEEREER